jgi:hypothetical protein
MEHVAITRTALVSIDSIHTHPENARRGDVAKVEASLREHGQYAPVIVHEPTGNIIKGNHTHRVMKEKLGKAEILASFVSCTDAQARAILAIDNKSTDGATYDDTALLSLLSTLDNDGMLAASGYDQAEMDDLLAALEEAAPPVPADDPFPPLHDLGEDKAADDIPEARSLEGKGNTYDQASTRMVVLNYSTAQFSWVIDKLAKLSTEWELDSNADMVLALVEEACGEPAPVAAP